MSIVDRINKFFLNEDDYKSDYRRVDPAAYFAIRLIDEKGWDDNMAANYAANKWSTSYTSVLNKIEMIRAKQAETRGAMPEPSQGDM